MYFDTYDDEQNKNNIKLEMSLIFIIHYYDYFITASNKLEMFEMLIILRKKTY